MCMGALAPLCFGQAQLHVEGGSSSIECTTTRPCDGFSNSQLVAAPPCNMFWDVVSLPFSRGGLGLRSAVLGDIQRWRAHIVAVVAVREELVRIGFEAPSWTRLAGGLRPVISDPEDQQLGMPGIGWQQAATDPVLFHFVESLVRPDWERRSRHCCVLKEAHCLALPFVFLPARWHVSTLDCSGSCSSVVSGFLSLHLPATAGVFGHQVLGRRGFALESAAARVCREAGARVGTNILVRDLDLVPQGRPDSCRLEVVADGLPLFHGAQLAINTTLVSPVGRDGLPRCAKEDGAARTIARRRKERTYPELTGPLAKWAGGGPLRRRRSCGSSPRQKRARN